MAFEIFIEEKWVFKAYTQPWFILYSLTVFVCLFTSVWFGLLSILIACVPIILVDLGIWSKSTEWINMSKKFRSRHRVFVGGMYVVIIISYILIGSQSLTINLIILGIVFQWVESLIRLK